MNSSTKFLNILVPILVTLMLNWLLLHPTEKPLRKLDKATRKKLLKTYPRNWPRIWSSAAIAAGNLAVLIFGYLGLAAITNAGFAEFVRFYPFIFNIAMGIVLLASGYASRVYCIIDSLTSLILQSKSSTKQQ